MSRFAHLFVATAHAADGIGTLPAGPVNSVGDLANRLLNLLTYLAYPLAFAAVVYTAYILISAGSSPDGWTKAKKNLTYLLIGIFLIVFASIFVALLHHFFNPVRPKATP